MDRSGCPAGSRCSPAPRPALRGRPGRAQRWPAAHRPRPASGFDLRDGRGNQSGHLGVGGNDHRPAHRFQPILVQSHVQGAGGAHHAHHAGGCHASQFHGGGVDDVQDRQSLADHLIVPAVRGVAGDRHCPASGRLQSAQTPQQPRQRSFAAAQPAEGTIGHTGIRPEHGRDVVLIACGRRQLGQPDHEVRAGQGTHATQDTEDSIRHSTILRTSAPHASRCGEKEVCFEAGGRNGI